MISANRSLWPFEGRLRDGSSHSRCSLRGDPRIQLCRGTHQVIGNDAETDPPMRAVRAMIATASQAMSPLEHTDAALAAHAPVLTAPEPRLPFVRAARRRLASLARQDHPTHAALMRGLFILGGGEAPIDRRYIRCAPKGGDVSIQRRRPQRRSGRPRGMNLVIKSGQTARPIPSLSGAHPV